MASQSKPVDARQRRNVRFSVAEVIEQLQTAGSDVEDTDGSSSEPDFDESSSDSDISVTDDEVNNSSASDVGHADNRPDEHLPADHDLEADPDGLLHSILQPWNENFSFFPVLPDFYGQDECGLHVDHMDSHAPIDFFSEMFDDNIMQQTVDQSNKYARETIVRPLTRDSMFRHFPVNGLTVNDLLGFYAICVHMCLDHKPEISDYWSTSPILQSDFARNIMPRDKFFMILAVLHVSDNDCFVPRGRPGYDPLAKIRPIYEHLRARFRALYTPGKNIRVDEAVCPWRGDLSFRVYVKDKPIKWGIKFYELRESKTAYVFDFEIYGGIPGLSNRPVDVVTRLAEPLLNKGRCVYVDDYFCCPELAENLAIHTTHTVGTVQANRKGMPPQLKTTPLPRQGQMQTFRQGAVSVLRWFDKKAVHLLTTREDPRPMVNVVSRKNPNNQKMKPVAVQDYITRMSGVHKSDQLMSYAPLRRRSIKWWKKVFFHLFTLCLIQGSILHEMYHTSRGGKKLPLKKFVEQVGLAMNEKYQAGAAAATAEDATPAAPQDVAADPGAPAAKSPAAVPALTAAANTQTRLYGTGHYPTPIGSVTSGSGRKKYRVCHVCVLRANRHPGVKLRKSANQCGKCRVTLCDKPYQPGDDNNTCFQLYHTTNNYVDC